MYYIQSYFKYPTQYDKAHIKSFNPHLFVNNSNLLVFPTNQIPVSFSSNESNTCLLQFPTNQIPVYFTSNESNTCLLQIPANPIHACCFLELLMPQANHILPYCCLHIVYTLSMKLTPFFYPAFTLSEKYISTPCIFIISQNE